MNKMPALLWLKADDVAREGYDAVMKGRSVVVNGAIYRFLVWLTGAVPRGLARWVSGSAGRRYRKT
jgi:short-subunit dehydrogenase